MRTADKRGARCAQRTLRSGDGLQSIDGCLSASVIRGGRYGHLQGAGQPLVWRDVP